MDLLGTPEANMMLYGSLIALLLIYIVHIIMKYVLRKDSEMWSDMYMGEFGPGTRRLGQSEELMMHIGRFAHINLTNAIIIRSKKAITKEMVHEALLRIAARHPMLHMHVVEDKKKNCYYYKPMEKVRVNLSVAESGDWKSAAEEQLRIAHDVKNGPMWRIVFLPDTSYPDGHQGVYTHQFACVFGFSHICIDGTSYMRLFGEFADVLGDVVNNKPSHLEPYELLPPIEAYIGSPPELSLWQKIRRTCILLLTNFPKLFEKLVLRNAEIPAFAKYYGLEREQNPDAPKKGCIIPLELPEEQTTLLLRACKEHKVTVHGFFQAAACIAYAELSQGGTLKTPTTLVAGPTVNMRPHIQAEVPADYVGACYSLVFMQNYIELDMNVWDLANTVTSFLRKSIADQVPGKIIHYFNTLLEILKNVPSLVTRPDPLDRLDDMHFTNLGNVSHLNRGEDSDVKITARFGCSSEHLQGPLFTLNLATFNGKMFITCVYYTHVTSEAVAHRFADMLLQKLSNP